MNKPKDSKPKMFIVRKYVLATSAAEVILKEPKEPVHEIFIDDEWRKNQKDSLANAIGFHADQ